MSSRNPHFIDQNANVNCGTMISSEGCLRCPILAIDRYEQLASDPIAATPSYERNRLFHFWQRLGNGPRGDMTSKENFTPDGGSLSRP